ncbi:Protein kinase C signaling pathway involved MAPKK protein [Coemansia javaensis]|uniref:Protein kinase C signaling pathway involved MAPKK protein n=1 Tax=Coemansia javaensis TaxID=2761396 RepID=A0A9W8LHS1_9FUNG|nr:Protein kinase C signaling pathway involved MAPKK protein [Coemansia javaensis]
MASLNRSNATAARGARPLPPRLYTATTPRGQAPALPRLQIPAGLPRVQTSNLPASSGGDQAAREQSRETHNLGLSIVTTRPSTLAVPAAGTGGSSGQQLVGQLEQLNLSSAVTPTVRATSASAMATTTIATTATATATATAPAAAAAAAATTPAAADDDEEEYALSDDNIRVMRKLGEGSVGTVHKIEYIPRGKIMARKLMAVYPDEANHRQIVRELRLLKQCQSPYIVKYYGAYFSADDDGQSIAICMEYCAGGSLESVYKRVARLNAHIGEGVLGKVAVAMLNGLVHLHTYKVIHRDVKPSNILLTGRGEIKLCDFGVSGELVDSIAQTFVGTSYYMAPERIQGDRYAVQSDIWSLGLSLIEASQNQFPFPPPGHPQLSVIELLEYIIHMPVPGMDPKRFSPDCCDFVRQCLIKDPSLRPTPAQLLKHPFIVASAAKRLDLKSWIEQVWGAKK